MERLKKVTLSVEESSRYRRGYNDYRPFFSQGYLFVYDLTKKTYDVYLHQTADSCTRQELIFKADDWKYHVYLFGGGEVVLKRVNRSTKAIEWLTGSKAETIDWLLDVYNVSASKPDLSDCLRALSR